MGRTLSVVALLIAFVALGLGGWLTRYPETFRPSADKTFSEQQRAEAKTEACTAYNLVSSGVFENTNRQSPGPPEDVVAGMAVVANAKVALVEGGQYLHAKVVPATPPELADALQRFGDALMQIGAGANAGVLDTDPGQAELFKNADTVNNEIKAICG